MESLNDAIRLRAFCFCPRVVNVLDCEIELVFMPLGIAAVFRSAVGEHAEQLNTLLLKEGKYSVVQEVGGGDRGLAIV